MTRTKSQAAAPSKKAIRTRKLKAPASEVMTLAEAAAYLRVAPEEVLRMVNAAALPGRQFGTEWRFFKTALQDWLSTPPKTNGPLAQLGKAKDDPHLQEMLDEIYRQRGRSTTAED